ncbi:MAG: hypothetical protein ACREEC_14480, partial [Thermoplasmata archaeon]
AVWVQYGQDPLVSKTLLEAGVGRWILTVDAGGSTVLTSLTGYLTLQSLGGLITFYNGSIQRYNGTMTAGLGVGAIYGAPDNRLLVTVTDGAALTIYTTTGATQLYRLMARVFGASGTVSAASYVVTWTEGGAKITKTLSISAVDTDADLSILIQPDTGTAITAQLTVLTGTAPKVDVACSIEELI